MMPLEMTDSTGPKPDIVAAVETLRPAGATGDQRRAFLDAGFDQPLDLGAAQLGNIGQLAPRRRLICATSPTLN